ncbi:MAG: Gfo/Idh/MocA family oxidoreductase [Methanosarcinales archaeon]|nr:Gfo/Idh/MocA family oxidoreductase [Methanosarcinales archaeon]
MKVGIIGAGKQAINVHLPILNSIDGVEVVGIADIDKIRVETISKRYNIPNAYTDYNKLLDDDLDFVLISTPHHLHKKMTLDSALAGKHILIEKPMATTVKDADEMIRVAKENNVKLCIVQNYRFFPAIKDLKARIENGRIGEIISIHGHMLDFPPLGAGTSEWRIEGLDNAGVIEDIGPHLIDVVLQLNKSEIMQINAIGGCIGGNLNLIDHTQIMIEFEDKSSATLDLSWMTGGKEMAIYVQGTGGLLHCDVRNNFVYEIHQFCSPLDDFYNMTKKLKRIFLDAISGDYFIGPKKFHQEIIRNFIESIESDTNPPVTGEEGRRTALVIENALKSIRNGESVFFLRDEHAIK